MIQQSFDVLKRLLEYKKLYLFLIPGALITLSYLFFQWIFGWLDPTDSLPADAGWWSRLMHTIEESGKWIVHSFYQFIMITILSPVMAILAERADNFLSGAKFDGGLTRILKDLLRTIMIVTTAFFFFFIIYLVWNMFAWIVGLGFLTPYIMFLVNAFFIGFAYMDYALERYQYSIGKSWQYGVKNSWVMLGLGALFSAIFYIPYLGALAAPFLITLLATSIWHVKEVQGNTPSQNQSPS